MSTHATVQFSSAAHESPDARVYLHYDGYPEGPTGVLARLAAFFADVREQAPDDMRFDDPPYLAAKFVVWQAARYSRGRMLDFTGVGVAEEDDGHIYRVACTDRTTEPEVRQVSP